MVEEEEKGKVRKVLLGRVGKKYVGRDEYREIGEKKFEKKKRRCFIGR
jgi:hypothetical protein